MFETLDYAFAVDAETALHQLLDPVREAGILSKDDWEEVKAEIDTILDLIRNPSIVGENFWRRFRSHFGFASTSGRPVPMNAANLCPEPTGLLNAANKLRLLYNTNVAQQTRMARGRNRENPGVPGLRVEQLRRARKAIADGLGVKDPYDVALVRNASEANNAVNCGYRGWAEGGGENVVLWEKNHPTNLAAWRLRSQDEKLFKVRVVEKIDFNEATDLAIAEAFTRPIDANTRFVAYSAISNGDGIRIPDAAIKMIWKHAKQFPNCHVHIDGTMVWGARPVDLDGDPFCHSFVSSGHKWFLGPKETGVLYMRKDRVKYFTPSIFAYDYAIYIDGWEKALPDNALRFELLGQRDDVNIITLALTQLIWQELVTWKRDPYGRVKALGDDLFDKLRKADWKPMTPASADRRWSIVRVKAPQEHRKQPLEQWLFENNIAGGGGGGDEFRLCPHLYNSQGVINNIKGDIDKVVDAMNRWRSQG